MGYVEHKAAGECMIAYETLRLPRMGKEKVRTTLCHEEAHALRENDCIALSEHLAGAANTQTCRHAGLQQEEGYCREG